MVFRIQGEQRLDFKIHNTTWEPVDFDGLKLVRKPAPQKRENLAKSIVQGKSKELYKQIGKSVQMSNRKKLLSDDYVVIDIETTGLSFDEDRIIEVAAIHVKNGHVTDEFSTLVRSCDIVPPEITALTGITTDMMLQGMAPAEALSKLCDFIGSNRLVCHNASFDLTFLQIECKRVDIKMRKNPITDTLIMARRKIVQVNDYKLYSIAQYFNLSAKTLHRALDDCHLTHRIYMKLNEI